LAKLPKYVQKASNITLNFSKRYFVQIAVIYLLQNLIRGEILFSIEQYFGNYIKE
jgi:hypothetical protein